MVANSGEKAPIVVIEHILSEAQRERITSLAARSEGVTIVPPDFSESELIPDGFNGSTRPSKVAVEFLYRSGHVYAHERPEVRVALLAKEAPFAKLVPEERLKYGRMLAGTVFEKKFDTLASIIAAEHGDIYAGNIAQVKGFMSYVILTAMVDTELDRSVVVKEVPAEDLS